MPWSRGAVVAGAGLPDLFTSLPALGYDGGRAEGRPGDARRDYADGKAWGLVGKGDLVRALPQGQKHHSGRVDDTRGSAVYEYGPSVVVRNSQIYQ